MPATDGRASQESQQSYADDSEDVELEVELVDEPVSNEDSSEKASMYGEELLERDDASARELWVREQSERLAPLLNA